MNTLRRICHFGPLTTLGMIKVITGVTIYCNSKWWPPADSIGGALNSLLFFTLSSMAIINFFTALYDGPGFLPRKWQPPDNNTKYLQYCEICLGYKAPRSHHCRKCHRCVLKMDHHCPWINGCVGYQNHGHFILFIFFSVCGCIHSIVVVSCTLQEALTRGWYYHQFYNIGPANGIYLGVSGLLLSVFSLGISIGVVFAVGVLLYLQEKGPRPVLAPQHEPPIRDLSVIERCGKENGSSLNINSLKIDSGPRTDYISQLRSLIRNRTAVEEWILEKAAHRRLIAKLRGENIEPFVFPYNLGVWKNITEVLNWRMKPDGDGITWKIREHPKCDQYTLTREQIEQKAQKRLRSRVCSVIKNYSGSWVPISFGVLVLLNPPFTDEDRLPLVPGECLRVTRSRKYWLFGEKLHSLGFSGKTKGWFPRTCVIEMTGSARNVTRGAGDATGGARDVKDGAKDVKDGAKDVNDGAEDANDGAEDLNGNVEDAVDTEGKKDR